MVRNVVMGRLRPAADESHRAADVARLESALAGIAALDLPGCAANEVGRDIGLRSGGWDFAISNVWQSADDYRRYDSDPEHNVHRAAIVEVSADVARVQFEI